MSLSLDDYEDVKQEEKQSAAIAAADAASSPASAASSGTGIKPPTSESTTSGLNVPGLINQAWDTVKPYLNPIHYNAGGPQDYTNIDVPTTAAHGLVEGAAGLGLANRIKRGFSGESSAASQYAEQNKLARERFEYQKQRDALVDAGNQKQVEQKITAQAAGKPVPEARIEPTLAPEPIPASSIPPKTTPQLPQATMSGQPQAQMQYGQTTMNAPVGTPSPIAPTSVEAAPAVFEPKPMSDIERLRLEKAQFELDAAKAKEARAAELHANKLAADAQRAEAKKQTITSSGGVKPETRQMLNSSENARIDKAVIAQQKAAAPKAVGMPIADTGVGVAALLPPETPPASTTVAPVADAVTPVAENKAPAVPNAEVAAAAEKTLKTRRTSEEVAAEKATKPYTSAKKTILSYLGAKESPEMEAKAKAALSTLKEKAYGGEKVKQTDSHINEEWAKGKAYILAHPEEFAPEIVERQKKSGEQLKSEASAKKNAKVDSQRGGINVDAIAEAGGKVAGAVKPVLGQAGALVGSEVKGAAAMLPFMLATDVGAQNTGYRRELEQQLKTERNASRAAELKSEIQKLDEDKYINSMKRRYVDKNIPAQLRPQ